MKSGKLHSLLNILKHPARFLELIRYYAKLSSSTDQTFWGSITEEDSVGIVENTRAAAAISGPIIEIGALFGLTTQLIATYKPVDKPLIAVELFIWNPFVLSPGDHRVFINRVLSYCKAHCNTRIYDGSNAEFYRSYQGETPAMVFIDADHSYEGVKFDIDWAVKMGVPIISGHDYTELHPGVKRAVDEAFGGDITIKGTVWTYFRKERAVAMPREACTAEVAAT